MRRTVSLLTIGAAALACTSLLAGEEKQPQPQTQTLALGSAVPMADQKMKNVDGKDLAIADVRGQKGTLVIFTCNACPWAKAWEDRITAFGNDYQAKGIGVIAVNSNDPGKVPDDGYEGMQQRAKDKKFAFPYVVDATSQVARAFGAARTPEIFLFDATGKLAYHGTIDDNAQEPAKVQAHYLRDALDSLVAGRDIALKETKALGCGIKFRS